ncbi:hypothetical protein [Castellaniella sp.]|uniref:hypothetical protein n=1 Tax=Castellaniella sp. TaxID=1955812 RepID=UPI002AFE1416|nr:hypothetical protein [Castellaniella sp.]
MNMTAKKLRVAALVCALGAPSAHAALYGGGPAESWTIGEIAASTAEVSGNIASFGLSFATQMQLKFEQIISAISVATSQEALSASVVADGTREAAAQLVNAVKAQRVSDQTARAYLSFNPATGQGYDPCGTLAKNKTLTQAFDSVPDVARLTMKALDVAPGKVAFSADGAMVARMATHREKFCSAEEAKAGLCKVSELPGGDMNAALLFEPASPGSLKAQARQAYIQNVVGAPITVPGNVAASGAAVREPLMVAVAQQSAMMSIPAYSLAMIDAANTQSPEFGGKSANEVLALRVNQYFGGAEAKEWSGSMARQSTRGLLVEHAKMAGMQAWVRQRQKEQGDRIEANVAALLVIASKRSGIDPSLEYERARKGAVRSSVQ